MRILHISDLHFDKNDCDQSITHIVKPLIKTIEEIQVDKPIDLILITGDLLNKGGENYSSVEEAFDDIIKSFIEPLLNCTSLTRKSIFFVPGNHDVVRNLGIPT